MTSPDQASQATMLPAVRSWMYSLPVNALTCPAFTTPCRLSIACPHCVSVKSSGSAPTTFSMNAIVSRISDSSVILPLRSGRVSSSEKLLTSSVFAAL